MANKIGIAFENTYGIMAAKPPDDIEIVHTTIEEIQPVKDESSIVLAARFPCPCCGKVIYIEVKKTILK